MFYKKLLILFYSLSLLILSSYSQTCLLTIKGHVFDEGSEMPLSYVKVFVQESGTGTITDDQGNFSLENICPGEYHLTFSHIGCEGIKIHVDVTRDTTIRIALSHSPTSLGEVVIKGQRDELLAQPNLSVNRQTIEDNINQNLSGILENESGVHLLKNGSGIAKPVVHGLYGNRLTILNNGIVQSGQQWGNDHSPEIDPFAADYITLIKGTNAIQYAGGNLGSVILVQPQPIEKEPHLHGQVGYIFESNGRGSTLNARLGKYSPKVAWRLSGSLKKYGDQHTPDYYLNNTGLAEANLALQLEKSWKDKLYVDFYASTFNTRLGILRGSHIGNLTDLEQALLNEVPFFTEPDFSYELEAPKQHVSHHLVKGKAKYLLASNQIIELVLAGQVNDRKEFDVRRGGRSETPALSLSQYTFNTELYYSYHFGHKWKLKLGNQQIFTNNINNPGTGIFPLIPDYFSLKSGWFGTLSKKLNQLHVNVGIRHDYEHQQVATFSRGIPRELLRYENHFHNTSGLAALKLNLTPKQTLSLNTGYAMRNPAINELYSNGLHQGVSGIEEGDINLRTEKALKNTLEYEWIPHANFSFSALLYHQHFSDFIYLNPQDDFRLTIRGAFPVFKYEQTDANIYGLDVSTQFTINNSLLGTLKYSYLRGRDIENNSPLIFMPPNSLFGSLIYRAKKHLNLSQHLLLEESEIEISNRLVFEQKNILPEQDFLPPPPAYNLLSLKISSNVIFSNYKIRCFIKADNLLNARYRDYLNRQRYFADERGRSVSVGVNFRF